ncbi:hypothetical protein NUW54_g13336 [Trametes sanguinea]|uniref:Uncharacterized protein n=1 Tax=Trametes sanguinea TaxID=158606 RepID=A0ACC1MN06_9APHY|nr:hypothetical protein NUW54_g13336 [Trametes sanguinea]
MQDPSPTKTTTVFKKGKEREPVQTDIADKIIALRRKQATATAPRERPERTQPSSSSRPTTARPLSPRRLHAPPVPSPNIVVSEASPSQMDADSEDFSRRLKISYSSPRTSHARPAANGSPGNTVQDGTAHRLGASARPERVVQPPEQALRPRGHEHADETRRVLRPKAEVFIPLSAPSGLISATVSRK